MKSSEQNLYTNFITFSYWVCMFPFRSIISIWGISTYRLKLIIINWAFYAGKINTWL